jgi:hypothetical protein
VSLFIKSPSSDPATLKKIVLTINVNCSEISSETPSLSNKVAVTEYSSPKSVGVGAIPSSTKSITV